MDRTVPSTSRPPPRPPAHNTAAGDARSGLWALGGPSSLGAQLPPGEQSLLSERPCPAATLPRSRGRAKAARARAGAGQVPASLGLRPAGPTPMSPRGRFQPAAERSFRNGSRTRLLLITSTWEQTSRRSRAEPL